MDDYIFFAHPVDWIVAAFVLIALMLIFDRKSMLVILDACMVFAAVATAYNLFRVLDAASNLFNDVVK